jgi:nucleoside-diphosphate-sugar epimerase
MKAAVTGGTGFVGGHLVDGLLRRGAELSCLVRSAPRGVPLEARGCRVVPGSLHDEQALDALVSGADVVFHVAGAVAALSEAEFLRVNRDGTSLLAAASARAGAGRFVYVSSLAVSGPARPGHPLDEGGTPAPLTPYGRSKLAGEEGVRRSGVPFTIVRPPVVYGPRDRELLRIFRLVRRGIAPLLGDGRQELSLVHAGDLARALIAAAASPATAGRVYHAAGPERVTQRELSQLVGRALRKRPLALPVPGALLRVALAASDAVARLTGTPTLLGSDKLAEFLAPAWICSSEALARDAGWRAAIPLERGLAETAQWYREARWL